MPVLNPRVAGRPASATLVINERSRQMLAAGHDVTRFGFGQSPFPVPADVIASLQASAPAKDYEPTAGLPELRQAVADWHQRRGVTATRDDVLIGPGSKELIFLVQFALDCELLLPAPSWVSYSPQAELLGLPVQWLDTTRDDGWRLSPETLAQAGQAQRGRPQLLVLNYPSNPAGTTLSPAHLDELTTVARRYGIFILSDEIYGELDHKGTHYSLARSYPEGTIVTGGLSKWCGAGGWRLGTALFPQELRELRDGIISLASETYSAVAAPIQRAAVTAFEGTPAIEAYVEQSRRIVAHLGGAVAEILTSAGIQVAPPEGGFYLFPDFSPFADQMASRGIGTSTSLCTRLLEESGVALLPGEAFGRKPAELTARLAYVDFDGAEALETPPDAVERYADRVLEGAHRMAQWVGQ